MKKMFLVLCVFVICVFYVFGDTKEPPKIKYLKPNEYIDNPTSHWGFIHNIPPEENYILAIKEGDKDHVRVISRILGLEYPDVELLYQEEISKDRPLTHGSKRIMSGIYKGERCYPAFYNGKYGVINTQGKIIIPFIYDDYVSPAADDTVLVHKFKGLLDENGKEIIPKKYTKIEVIKDKYVYCEKSYLKNSNGILDLNNNVVIPFEYDSIYYVDDDFIIANKVIDIDKYRRKYKYKGYMLNIKNEILKEYDSIVAPLCCELNKEVICQVNEIYSKNFLYTKNLHDLKMIDTDGNVVAEDCDIRPGKNCIVLKKQNKITILNYDGKVIFEGTDCSWTSEKNIIVIKAPDYLKVIDLQGNTVIDKHYENFQYPSVIENGKAYVYTQEAKYLLFKSKKDALLFNIDTQEKKKINSSVNVIDNNGNLYIRKNITENDYELIPYIGD